MKLQSSTDVNSKTRPFESEVASRNHKRAERELGVPGTGNVGDGRQRNMGGAAGSYLGLGGELQSGGLLLVWELCTRIPSPGRSISALMWRASHRT
jgi:hypothetical protein